QTHPRGRQRSRENSAQARVQGRCRMSAPSLSSPWSTIAPAVANHLWQSTLIAVAAGLLTLLLRKHNARARYWLWLAASLKFLVPFSLLVALGDRLSWSHSP